MNYEFVGVIVDAGHGGIDSGAVGNNLVEKDLNLQASQYMYKRLIELGIPAKMTRTDDEYLPKEDRIKRVLELYNNSSNTLLIANHINAGGGEGAEVVYALKNEATLANMILNNIGEAGQIKRKAYQRRLPEDPSKDYYYIIRETGNVEPILVEYGFIDNKKDAEKLRVNLDKYVEAVVKAIAEYIGVLYYPPGTSIQDTYIVQRGDTLYAIARKYNMTVEELKRINNLTSNTLSIGQILKLRELDGTYIVQRGDTLYSIANKFNTTVESIIKANRLSNDILTIGQKLLIPETQEEEIVGDNYEIYEVKKGDSLWLIATNYKITVQELIEINNLETTTIQIGQLLKVPYQNEETIYYTVQKGDTLFMGNNECNII